MLDEILKETKPKMEEQIRRFLEEIKTIRAGKAEISLVEDIQISYYGSTLPLKQMASISTPSPTLIVIEPWDKNALGDIELAIRNSGLSLNPTNDGNLVRISLPPLSLERRKELSKIIKDKGEETKVSLRNIRQEAWQKVVKAEREHTLSEDDRYKGEAELNKMIFEFNKKIDESVKQKEAEIMRI
jgi:ribosome recycling factor